MSDPLAKLKLNAQERKRFQRLRINAMADVAERENLFNKLGMNDPGTGPGFEMSDTEFLLALLERALDIKA